MPHTEYRTFVIDPILRDIGTERVRQLELGRTPAEDDKYNSHYEDLARGAIYYAVPASSRRFLPDSLKPNWVDIGWSPNIYENDDIGRITQLRKAAALIVAEIERIQRKIDRGQQN